MPVLEPVDEAGAGRNQFISVVFHGVPGLCELAFVGGRGFPSFPDRDERLILAAEAIKAADALLISAGVGMGVDSGLPDFRGTQGFWRAYPAIAKLGLSFAEMANPAWFSENSLLAWAFYGHRLNL